MILLPFPDEFRLLYTIALNAMVLWSARRFVRRFNGSGADVLLLWFFVQYLAVGIPGIVGYLNVWTMSAIAALCSGMLFSLQERSGASGASGWQGAGNVRDTGSPPHPNPLPEGEGNGGEPRNGEGTSSVLVPVIAFWLVLGYLGALVFYSRTSPPLGDDGLIYHLPVAVEWLKSGSLKMVYLWFSSPANSYSPLGGSMFIAWLIAPMGNDVLARFCQMPALVLLYLAMVDLLKSLGVRREVAAIFAAACVLCRPFVSQTLLVKDDLFVAAFFACFIAGCARSRLIDRFGPWRLGISLGLLLSMKYTVLQLAAPLLLLVIDAPFRAGWKVRQFALAIGLTLVLALPWFIRNWAITGNPVFPVPVSLFGYEIFSGLFTYAPSTEMQTVRAVWNAFTEKYFGFAPLLLVLICGWWLAAFMLRFRILWRDPLMRTCFVGTIVGVAMFIKLSHAPEMRYAYASLLLLFAGAGMAFGGVAGLVAATVVLIITLLNTFAYWQLGWIIGGAAVVIAVIAAIESLAVNRWGIWIRKAWVMIFGIGAGLWVYVYWTSDLDTCNLTAEQAWRDPNAYTTRGELWTWVRQQLPPNARIATANVIYPYPLYGYRFERDLGYLPTRRNVRTLHDLPRGDAPMSQYDFRPWAAGMLSEDPDREAWLRRLREEKWQYLHVERQDANQNPIELEFARSHSDHFMLLFENETGAVFSIR